MDFQRDNELIHFDDPCQCQLVINCNVATEVPTKFSLTFTKIKQQTTVT